MDRKIWTAAVASPFPGPHTAWFFLSGQVKNEIYTLEVHTKDELWEVIMHAFDKIKDLAAQVTQMQLCIHKQGGHFEKSKT